MTETSVASERAARLCLLMTVVGLAACDSTPAGIDGPVVPTTDVAMACADAEALPLDATFSDDNYTFGVSQAISGSCSNGAAERIYRFEAAEAGNLRFAWNGDVATAVYAREVCASSSELLCEPAALEGAIELPLGAGDVRYIVVEPSQSADFTFMATFTPQG